MVDIVVHTIIVFKCITGTKYIKNFVTAATSQRSVIAQLALERCKQVVDMTFKCATCGSAMTDLAKPSIQLVCNNMGVCERHFDVRFIIRDRVFRRSDGSTFTSPRDAPTLSDDAVPTLFPNTPSYLSSVPPPKRRNPDNRREELSEIVK